MADYDLAIIGGGLNGTSIARDAAGRGLRVLLLEQGDLASAASGASSRLIHGDLALLEHRQFFRVRARLVERERWLNNAPHLVRPTRFAIPLHPEGHPPWLLRTRLRLYDRLAATALPPSQTVDVTHHPIGNPLQRPFGIAFDYSDCVVDATRLVVLNALDAAERGAVIRTGARCVRADRSDIWRLVVIDRGYRRVLTARALANTAGAWAPSVAETVLRQPLPRDVGATQMSQIIVRRLFETDHVYVFQNGDGRLIFASPYERDFTLVGTVERSFTGDPSIVAMPAADIAYLCDALGRYLRDPVHPADVVRSVSGVNLAAAWNIGKVPQDGLMLFDQRRRLAPLLTLLGGEITTARLRAERAVSRLTPFYPMSPRWTATAKLPGGDFDWHRFDHEVFAARERWPFLGEAQVERLVGAYGKRLSAVLGEARSRDDLGQAFGPELTEAEVRYLMTCEWARFPDDILWRRSTLGLSMAAGDREALAGFMTAATAPSSQKG